VHATSVPGRPKEPAHAQCASFHSCGWLTSAVVVFFILDAAALLAVVTTTEAAVIGCFLSILLGFVFGD